MKSVFLTVIFFLLLWSATYSQKQDETADFVNPFIGTSKTHFISQWRSEAATYPGAVAPHGKVQISPQTSPPNAYLQGYYYWQDTIRKFSIAEHFSGWPNGSAGKGHIMPFSLDTSQVEVEWKNVKSAFSHQNEQAEPGFYEVFLDQSRIKCRFAALTNAAIGEFDFQKKGTHGILISGTKKIEQIAEKKLKMVLNVGRREFSHLGIKIHVFFQFDTPFSLREKGRKSLIFFSEKKQKQKVKFKYSASYVSEKNAVLNMKNELPDWNFEATRKRAKNLWNKELSRIEVKGGSPNDKIMFYTALYHASLLPINATDTNGEFPGHEKNTPLRPNETHYMYFTPWDAFRTLHPLINLINPKKGTDFMRSALRFYRAFGHLPEPEVMTGVHFSVLFADAIAKGIDDFDKKLAFKALSELILKKPYFRKDMALYDSLGYVPYPQNYATTATLEFAFNDWALAQVAKETGNATVYQKLMKRSLNYRNNYHPAERFMLSKNADGSWADAPIYAEADRWNMSWLVPHNTRDLINLMGGNQAFAKHLERNFTEKHFVLDNECPMNFPFLFSYCGKPWKTMLWKQKILRKYFNPTPGGIPGNDDWGTMSSWYIWGALGLFPACPGTDELIISAPIFEKIILHLSPQKQVVIETEGISPENFFVQSCRLGEKNYEKPYVSQSEWIAKGKISFKMGSQPNKSWGTRAVPYSMSSEKPDFQALSLKSKKTQTTPHTPLVLNARIQNKGAAGSYFLNIQNQHRTVHSEWVLIGKKQTKDLKIPVKLYRKGKQTLRLENQKTTIKVKTKKHSQAPVFSISQPRMKSFTNQKDSVWFLCRVKNISGFEKAFQPVIFLNGKEQKRLSSKKIAPGKSIEIQSFVIAPQVPGLYKLRVNDSPESRFKVAANALDKLVLHYRFENDSQTICDESGFENHGTVVGQIRHVASLSGKGIRFENGYIRLPQSQSLSLEGDQITLLCWYKPENEKGKASLITRGGHNMLKLNGKWQIKLAIGGWGRGQCFYNAKPKPENIREPSWMGEWTHFAAVKTPRFIQVFCNGILKNQLEHEGKTGHSDFEWRIGSNSEMPANKKPDGILDEVMIFAGALTEREIQGIFNAVSTN